MIPTPFLWFSQLIKGVPKPWENFQIDGIMVNAFEIIKNKNVCMEVKRGGIHHSLNFQGPVMMDSGGFLFMNERKISVHPKDVLDLYEESKPDFGVILDHPLSPQLSPEEIRKRQVNTLNNTRYMVRKFNKKIPKLIPVIHGNTITSVKWYLEELEKIDGFDFYGIGSLMPSVFSSKGAGGIYNVAEIVAYVRKRLPNKMIHVFGVGSTLTMHLMFYAGANSVDSTGWRTKAAYGAIQLPGMGDRYITRRVRHIKYPDLSNDERKVLDGCKCPVCRKASFDDLVDDFKSRAIHNAWVFQNEVKIARKLIHNEFREYEKYVSEVLKPTIYNRIFELIKKNRTNIT
jgi:tRNA-guanine family transglycosylase